MSVVADTGTGEVVWAEPVSGHPLLRQAAGDAACKALSKIPEAIVARREGEKRYSLVSLMTAVSPHGDCSAPRLRSNG